jgi:hypothetical protein
MSFAFQPIAALARLLLCRLLPVWCVLTLGAGSASAMSTSGDAVPAPMCDPDGASVAAGDDIPEIDRGRFEALPCEAQLLLAGWRTDAPELGCKAAACHDGDSSLPSHSAQPPRFRYEGAAELGVPFPEHAEPVLASFADREGLAPSRGHARGLFRPPVARA